MAEWDLVIRRAKVFDGTGAPPRVEDVAIAGGRVAARGPALVGEATRELDAAGRWLLPGVIDVHTHYDLEVELAPGLTESVRHGVTTVVMSNCSLGLAFGHQRHTGHDPVVSCFARVENVPKALLAAAADRCDWTTPAGYLDHLRAVPLGPNVVPMLPHSMLRVEVMGLPGAISRRPTAAELDRMVSLVEQGLDAGYVGLSTDALPFHYLADDPHRRIKIPTQHAGFGELRRLTDALRGRGRIWQTTPPKDTPLAALRSFLLSSGRLFGRPLTVTAVAAMEVVPNKSLLRMARLVTSLVGSRLLDGRLVFQSLPARFKVWSDGPISPLSEEVEPLRRLNEPDLEDRAGRLAVLRDPAWRARFRAWWTAGKRGWSLARLRRLLRLERTQLTRDLADMVVDGGPVAAWHGLSLAEVHARVLRWQRSGEGAADAAEAEVLAEAPVGCDDVSLLLWLFERFDTALTWWTITANPTEEAVADVLFDERFLPGFSDAGAHLSNMAFYDVHLRALRHAARRGDDAVARMVRRLTAEPAALFGVDAGSLAVGAVADLAVVDPTALAAWDPEASVRRVVRPELGVPQRVNRADGVVPLVVIGGRIAWEREAPAPTLGIEPFGRVLTATA